MGKYVSRIDKFCKRAVRFGYTAKYVSIYDIIQERDKKLWNDIIVNEDHPLYDLLPPKKLRHTRERGDNFIEPLVRTERFKQAFINRSLFNFV